MTLDTDTAARIGLFGGSFDPPHVAHQMVCVYALAAADVDEVWVVPCLEHPLQKDLSPFNHRYEMCRLATEDLGRVRVSDVEFRLGPPSRTLHTLRHLKSARPRDAYVLVVGGDILEETHEWYGWDEITRLAELFVVGRAGYRHQAALALPELSSTKIRDALSRGVSVKGWVPQKVLSYIEEHGLYRAR